MAVVLHAAVNRAEAPACTVCIANYNGEHLLADCLDSVLEQATDFAIEIIVHDDASTDRSLDLLRERYPQVKVIASDSNVGFCVGNNRMAAQARGDYLLLLNNDAALWPGALTTLMNEARAQSTAGILTLPQYDWESGDLVDRGCLLDPFYNPTPNLDPDRRDVGYVIGACLWIPRLLWIELGGFPAWFESIGEDLYLCCMARSRSRPVEVAASAGYRHRQGASFGGNRANARHLNSTVRRRRLSERNKTRVLLIFTPTLLVWPLLLLHLVLLAIEGFALGVITRNPRLASAIYGHAIASTVADLGVLRRARRNAQETRTITLRRYARAFTLFPRKLALLRRYGIPTVTR